MEQANINPISVASELLEIVSSRFAEYDCSAAPTCEEKLIAEELLVKLAKITDQYDFVEESENYLEPDFTAQCSTRNSSKLDCTSTVDNKDNDPDYQLTSYAASRKPVTSIKQKAKILKLIETHKEWSFETIRKQYPAYAHRKYKKQWQEQVQNGGTREEILFEIDKFVFESFSDARNEFKPVHDHDIRRWALQRAAEFPSHRNSFLASESWVNDFKRRHKISSRKRTKLVSKRNITALEVILANVESFRKEIQELQGQYELENIWNTDQIPFHYEYVDTRTLSWTNERITFGSAFSPQNKLTHPFTVELIVSAAGSLVGQAFVCLQEQSGKFGNQVTANLFTAPNLCISCSKSGKMSGSMVSYFFNNVAKPNINGKVLYILDAWGAHTNCQAYQEVGEGNMINIKVIPKNGTQFCQPLDVYFNRQLKYFVRKFKSFANVIDRDTGNRNNTLKLISLAHFILSAPIFSDMIRYCWIKSGLVNLEKKYFENVRDVCFKFKDVKCQETDCAKKPFLKCSWCRKVLCFECSFDKVHQRHCPSGPQYMKADE